MGDNTSVWTQHFSALPSVIGIFPFSIFCGIIANNIVVLVTFKGMERLQFQHYLMIGLAFADLMTLIPSGAMALTTLNGSIWLTEGLCDLLGVSFVNTLGSTSWIHSCMCIEKCLSITKPLQHRAFSTKRTSKFVICGIIAACYILPIVIPVGILYIEKRPILFSPYLARCSYLADRRLLASSGLIFIIIPLVIEFVTHLIMIRKIIKLESCSRQRQRIVRAIKVTSLTVGIYYSCWLPTVLYAIIAAILGPKTPSWTFYVMNNIVLSNSCMSTMIYHISLRHFRDQLHKNRGSVSPFRSVPSEGAERESSLNE